MSHQVKKSAKKRKAAVDDDLSPYERARLANIQRNEMELKRLGLHLNRLTVPATGRQAPTQESRRARAVPPRSRWSQRLKGKPEVDYREVGETDLSTSSSSPAFSGSIRRVSKKAKTIGKSSASSSSSSFSTSTTAAVHSSKAEARASAKQVSNPRSCKNLKVDLDHLDTHFLGKIIPPLGGQVKRAVMEEASASCSPKFSRMSGIQEWRNAILLFVNVFGDGYKNVFLDEGRAITWFAQSRQWEGTPVVQRLINCEGGTNLEGKAVRRTPVLLFCRNLGCGYVYCGRLGYGGHDPDRIPIRFIWELTDYEKIAERPDFQSLVEACGRVLSGQNA